VAIALPLERSVGIARRKIAMHRTMAIGYALWRINRGRIDHTHSAGAVGFFKLFCEPLSFNWVGAIAFGVKLSSLPELSIYRRGEQSEQNVVAIRTPKGVRLRGIFGAVLRGPASILGIQTHRKDAASGSTINMASAMQGIGVEGHKNGDFNQHLILINI
jgi:hypothetical protein